MSATRIHVIPDTDFFRDAKKTLPPRLYYKLVTPGGGEMPKEEDDDLNENQDISVATTTTTTTSSKSKSKKSSERSRGSQSKKSKSIRPPVCDALGQLLHPVSGDKVPDNNPYDWFYPSSAEPEKPVKEINIYDLQYDTTPYRRHMFLLPKVNIINPPAPKEEVKPKIQRPMFILPSLTFMTQALLMRIRETQKYPSSHSSNATKKKIVHRKKPVDPSIGKRCKICQCMCYKKVVHKCYNGITFGTKPAEKEIDPEDILPGPLDYAPNYKYLEPTHDGALMTGRPRTSLCKDETPGPSVTFTQFPHCFKYYGKTFAESKRFRCRENDTDSPGPRYNLQSFQGIGINAPKASIKSKKRVRKCFSNIPLPNLFGITRFGPNHSPSPLLLGRPCDPSVEIPGPNAYYITEQRSIRGLTFVKPEDKTTPKKIKVFSVPGPNRYKLRRLPRGPRFTFGMKIYKNANCEDVTPGPDYNETTLQYHPVSLTFKPFPPTMECMKPPGPMTYKGGEQALKTKPRQPAAIIIGRPKRSYYDEC